MGQKTGIRCEQLGKSYRHYQVFRDLSFEIASGVCYALFGPNGAGKTTLLKVLGTLQRPSSGRFEILGLDGVARRQEVRERVLLMGHGSYLYGELNAVENIRFSLALRGQSPTEREVKLALDQVGIGAFASYPTRYYSEGMKKRLSIARAMLVFARILLLDEPYASLDEKGVQVMNRFIRESLESGSTVLMTSHDRARATEVAHRAGVLHRGVLRDIPVSDLVSANELF